MEREGGGRGAGTDNFRKSGKGSCAPRDVFSSVSVTKYFQSCQQGEGGGGGREGGGVGPSPKSAPVYSTAHKASI